MRGVAGLKIENGLITDLEEVAGLHMEAWLAAYVELISPSAAKSTGLPTFRRQWDAMLRSDACLTLIARDNDHILGACVVGESHDPDLRNFPGAMSVHSIFVDPERFRQGIGRKLIEAHLKTASSGQLYAWAVVETLAEGRFYEGLGFIKEPETEKDFHLKGTALHVVRYRSDITE